MTTLVWVFILIGLGLAVVATLGNLSAATARPFVQFLIIAAIVVCWPYLLFLYYDRMCRRELEEREL